MKNMKNIDPINALDNIQKVDAPEFMLTRIYAKLDSLTEIEVKPTIAWSLIGTFALVVVINAFVMVKSNKTNGTQNIVTEMGMEVNNSIY
jgi:hypothetical protein